jgi:ADP-ribose pyrophosphatase
MQESKKDWRILSTEIGYQKKWIRVREESCELPSGKVLSPYIVVDIPHFCNVVMVTAQEEIVLVKQYRHAAGIVSIELPGGMIDVGEDPLEAVIREMQEETGYTSKEVELLYTVHPNPPLESNRAWFYLAKNVALTSATNYDPFEDIDLVILSKQDFLKMLLSHSFTHGTQSGAMYAAAVKLGWLVVQ